MCVGTRRPDPLRAYALVLPFVLASCGSEGVSREFMANLPLKPLVRLLSQIAFIALLWPGAGCSAGPETAPVAAATNKVAEAVSAQKAQRVREPAVAGMFYPADAKALSRALDNLLGNAPAHPIPQVRGLVCPHAGYEYSGQTAAIGYKTLAGRQIETVILLAPTHYAWFSGASIPNAEAYRTPLGLVPISEKAKALVGIPPFVAEPQCRVQRPPWWRQAPKAAPEPGQDTPETWEHSAEVQVPFLQKVAGKFKLLPILLGEVDPERVAKVLADRIDDKTIVVASSDLSHYHPYAAAKTLDGRCVKAICDLDIEGMKDQEACGKTPILALMHLAKLKGWKARLLDARNSGDATGEKDSVVGYSAVAFYTPGQENYGAAERKFMLELARQTLTSVVTNGPLPEPKNVAAKLAEKRACFVTLTKGGELRGCIGHMLPQAPLYQAVMDNARNAALRDPRFPPVEASEVAGLKIEISVLTEPQPLSFTSPEDLLKKLRPHEDGVLLRMGYQSATFLPQVWAQLPDKTEFLNHLAQKAGCSPSAWREPDTSVSIYHVESFEEN